LGAIGIDFDAEVVRILEIEGLTDQVVSGPGLNTGSGVSLS
jgi:hypothetical protein